jgi:hypothetical protein
MEIFVAIKLAASISLILKTIKINVFQIMV